MPDGAPIQPGAYAAWRASTLGRITEQLELDLVLELAGPLAGAKVLDVGTGDGTYAIAAATRGGSVVGVDTSSEMLAAARRRADEAGVALASRRGSAESLPFRDATFDVVFAVTLLCFVDDPRRAAQEMARVLAPGGHLVLADLGRLSTWAALRRIKGWFESDTWRGRPFWTPGEFERLALLAGMTVGQVRGAIYYPPLELAARIAARIDPGLGRLTPWGAAFIAVSASKPRS